MLSLQVHSHYPADEACGVFANDIFHQVRPRVAGYWLTPAGSTPDSPDVYLFHHRRCNVSVCLSVATCHRYCNKTFGCMCARKLTKEVKLSIHSQATDGGLDEGHVRKAQHAKMVPGTCPTCLSCVAPESCM